MRKCKIVGCANHTAALCGLCVEHESIVFYLVHSKGFDPEKTTVLYKRQLERIAAREDPGFFMQEINLEVEHDQELTGEGD